MNKLLDYIRQIPIAHQFRKNRKLIIQFFFTITCIGLLGWLIAHERAEAAEVKRVIATANVLWLWVGISLTLVYFWFHGLMYKACFKAIGANVNPGDMVVLYLKRNFASIFLPAGGVSSLALFSAPIEKKGLSKPQINFASSLFGFIGIFTVILVAVPAFLYAFAIGKSGVQEWAALTIIILMLGGVFTFYQSIRQKTWIYHFLVSRVPALEVLLTEIATNTIKRKYVLTAIFYSLCIEVLGVVHLYIAMVALGIQPSVFIAVIGYVVTVICMIVSPFFKGLGAVELSMILILRGFGLNNIEAVSVTILYRFFEFWLPMAAGAISFVAPAGRLVMRVLPALLLFVLGIINLVSALTPAIAERLSVLKEIVPVDLIAASNYFVFISGLFLLLTSAFMFKGSRTAWYFAISLCTVSMIGHLTKAIDYEEASITLAVITVLVISRKQYYVKLNPRLRTIGLQTAVMTVIVTLIYGLIGFYFLDKKHFGIDFSLSQSIEYTLRYFLQLGSDLVPRHAFAQNFLYSISMTGAGSLIFLIYTLVRPYTLTQNVDPNDIEQANALIIRFGKSSLDYFKTAPDKLLFFSYDDNAFLAYRVTGTFAVVLEDPVAANDLEMTRCIREFDDFCYRSGLKSIYYRVPGDSSEVHQAMGKRKLFLGQEGKVDLSTFTTEGGNRKSIRNSINKVTEQGYTAHIYQAPIKDGLLQKLRQVSDEWLKDTGRSEIIFSQGMFSAEELKQHTIITIETAEEKLVAFLNIIPDPARGEATYDLIRKTADAPSGVIDFLMVKMFLHLKDQGYSFVNLGLAPLSGIDEPACFSEKSMKFAYEKIKAFAHYKGIRDFKEKFNPLWQNQYLIYEQDFDLIKIPNVIADVIRPQKHR
jgi:phosphatidylglycerol lysyltransferase